MSTHIVDRRLNSGHKSLENRQRFVRRAQAQIRRAVKDASGKGSVSDVLNGGEVNVTIDGVAEHRLHREGGIRDMVLPGNKKFVEGDLLDRGEGGNGKPQNPGEGNGEDSFRFVLTRDEYWDLFLEDCELPELLKRSLNGSDQSKPHRAGYTMSGSPTAMAIPRTFKHSLMRRVALRGAIKAKIQELETELLGCNDEERKLAIREELEKCKKRLGRVAFIDPIDIRYKRFDREPTPVAQAVMFCLMDVSGSMNEHMKDLAKRFYMMLYVFLTRRYKKVQIVFIRHTDSAEEVDEKTFFYGPASGGTLVSSALEAMQEIVKKRFDPAQWNIYVAQASDGDNSSNDSERVAGIMVNSILPLVQYFAYLEVGQEEGTVSMRSMSMSMGGGNSDSALWETYENLRPDKKGAPITMRKVNHRGDIFPVFLKLFSKKGSEHAANA